jgi:hypothetical protein
MPYDKMSFQLAKDNPVKINGDRRMKDKPRAAIARNGKAIRYRTPEEARTLAFAFAEEAEEPQGVSLALLELMLNAVEHGVLGVGSEEKRRLIATGNYYGEIERRLALPEYRGRYVDVASVSRGRDVVVHIADPGAGFDWRRYLENASPPCPREGAPNGRGIFAARHMPVEISYGEPGNRAECVFRRRG